MWILQNVPSKLNIGSAKSEFFCFIPESSQTCLGSHLGTCADSSSYEKDYFFYCLNCSLHWGPEYWRCCNGCKPSRMESPLE